MNWIPEIRNIHGDWMAVGPAQYVQTVACSAASAAAAAYAKATGRSDGRVDTRANTAPTWPTAVPLDLVHHEYRMGGWCCQFCGAYMMYEIEPYQHDAETGMITMTYACDYCGGTTSPRLQFVGTAPAESERQPAPRSKEARDEP